MAEIRIVHGPNRLELSHSLMYAHAPVAFDIGGFTKLLTIHVFIDALEKVGGSTVRWSFKGVANKEDVSGTYNSIRHEGILKISNEMLEKMMGND